MGKVIVLDDNLHIRKNFTLAEVKCKHCEQVLFTDKIADVVQNIREVVKKPVHVHSWYRCPIHNKAIGGSPKSQHMLGNAVDIHVDGFTPEKLARIALGCGADGIGLYPEWKNAGIHIDKRGTKTFWINKNGVNIPLKNLP